MRILVTGAAGFIGYSLVKHLLSTANEILCLDSLNDYYSVRLKADRLGDLGFETSGESVPDQTALQRAQLHFRKADVTDRLALFDLFAQYKFDTVCHFAAQAGVRYSIENPYAYLDANIHGFLNILEACRRYPVRHLIFASSSSVYGLNCKQPYAESDHVDHPISLYAASKKSNELMAHSYSHLYNIPVTGLRFFTVYGPWGRPDMAYFKFADAISRGQPIDIYNNGDMYRDFTYIDDVVEGLSRLLPQPPEGDRDWAHGEDSGLSKAPYRIFNIGNNSPVRLGDFVLALEDAIGAKASVRHLPMQPGDVHSTYADIERFYRLTGFRPRTDIKVGLRKFGEWYKEYFRLS